MRVYLFCVRIMALGFLVFLTSCQGKNADLKPVADSETETSENEPAPAASTSRCDNGQPPKIISGECSGAWSMKKIDGALTCEFEWKPTVSCPADMKALGLQSACYGVTSRPAAGNIKSIEDCMSAHGKFPISPAYKLECCP